MAGKALWIKCGEFASATRSWRVRKLAVGIGRLKFHSFAGPQRPGRTDRPRLFRAGGYRSKRIDGCGKLQNFSRAFGDGAHGVIGG